MRAYVKLTVFSIFFVVALQVHVSPTAGELIEPTRTLEVEQQQTMGRLTVLSEPPGQKITLDGKALGKTPIFLVEIEGGVHTLRVTDSETEIYVEPEKTLKISLFKDEFVLIPVKEKEVEAQAEIQVGTEVRETRTTEPRDPIKKQAEADRKKAVDRWQQFLDRTKPTF